MESSKDNKITDWVKPGDKGEFKRQQSSFRNWISKDKNAKFPAEKGRYHLYVSYACPWVSAAEPPALRKTGIWILTRSQLPRPTALLLPES